jgi:hypothetical protein
MSEQDESSASGDGGQAEASEAQKKLVLEAVGALPPEVRSEIIDDLLETYCSMCAERLDEEGECPEGCDPEDLLNDDNDGEDDEDDEEDSEDDDEEDEKDPPEETGSA